MQGILLQHLSTSQAQDLRGRWLSAKACGACHPSEFEGWSRGPHARAGARLLGRAVPAQCESCHATGPAPAGRSLLKNVQCEACHGAGGHYASADIMLDRGLAQALGLRDLSTAAKRASLCQRCHEASTSIQAFDVETAWLQIRHK